MNRLSLRVRLTLSSVLVVALIMGFTGVAIINYADRSLRVSALNNVINTMARAQAGYLTGAYSTDERDVLPMNGDVVVQITNLAGTKVWAASAAIFNEPVLARAEAASSAPNGLLIHLSTSARTRSARAQLSYGEATTISTKGGLGFAFGWVYGTGTAHSLRAIKTSVFIAFPLLLIIWAALVWVGLGFALTPVEELRRRVATIAARDLSERVLVSGGKDELARLAVTLNAMLDRLEISSKFQQEFVSNASHELRSPLTTLLATVDHAAANLTSTSWPQVVDTVQREGRRLDALIDDLFWLARSDEDRVETRREEVDIDDLLFEEAQRVRSMSSLTVDTSDVQPLRIWGDSAMLKRLLRNVVDNAVRYASTKITLSARYDGAMAEILVHDDGIGVDVSTSDQYFGRFVRDDPSRARQSGGTGLGLTIVKDIITRHGGTADFIEVSSGTTMRLRLRRY